MTPKDAYKRFTNTCKGLTVVSCYEYDSVFVFNAVRDKVNVNGTRPVIDSLYSVDKKTGKVLLFKPFNITVDEYRRGKEIKTFK